jgi:alpha-galactosidase
MFTYVGHGLTVHQQVKVYSGTALAEFSFDIINSSKKTLRVDRVDTLSLSLHANAGEVFYYSGDWGSEFEPHRHNLSDGSVLIESRSGRSSKGHHPWFALTNEGGAIFSGSVAWSGNWVTRFEVMTESGIRFSAGINDWEFCKFLSPGEKMIGAPVIIALGETLNEISQQYTYVGRNYWYPSNEFSSSLPVEWNHWWPYEDAEINEEVFKSNVDQASEMGFDVCTLDAGWFGPPNEESFWEDYRGDWDFVNRRRFPGGIRALSDYTHEQGMKFGIWCEIEGLGEKAQIAKDHPEFVALRDGEKLGGLCFGNPEVQDWAYQTLAHLIEDYKADWIKVDFNLDLGAGCNRMDHGHQSGDGLYEHILGYYQVMTRIRESFPQVILENCSSGGLRIDLGSLHQTHCVFLSDPDWPVHDLQIFWGASTMLAPNVILHWPFSEWRNLNPPPYQTFDPWDPELTQEKWDFYSRISMLGLFGYSQKLPDIPNWLQNRTAELIKIYQTYVRKFVKKAELFRLTEQPRRNGQGDHWAAFQYRMPDGSENLLFVFRLPESEPVRAIALQGLEPDRTYVVKGFEGEDYGRHTGVELMKNGLVFGNLKEEESALLLLV